MKSLILLLKAAAIFVFISLALSACTKEDDPIDPGTGTPITLSNKVFTDKQEIWTNHNSGGVDYVISDRMLFQSNSKLTIEPGTEIVFENNAHLEFRSSTIKAIGTASAPILMRGKERTKGYWAGIAMYGKTDNALAYCQIEDAGGPSQLSSGEVASLVVGTALGDGGLSLENCRVANGGSHGLYIRGGSTLEAFTNNVITTCEYVASVRANSLGELAGTANTLTGNVRDQVKVNGNQVIKPATWPALPVSYLFSGTTDVYNEVTIEPGATLLFDNVAEFVLYKSASTSAKLYANGTPAKPILFKGAVTTPGYWKGIKVDFGLAQFNYCQISDAGGIGASPNNGIFYLTQALGTIDVTIQNCTISNSSNHGIAVRTNTLPSVTMSNNLFNSIAGNNVHSW
jgi:hypothetical protein